MSTVTVERMSAVRSVGERLPKRDGMPIATGRAQYTADVELPGMLYCRLAYSQRPHAKIVRIDTSKALALPGVAAVITARDVPELNRAGNAIGDREILASDKVRSYSDVIAAVAAVDEYTAARAVELIDVEYEDLPAVFTIEDALRPDAPHVHEDKTGYRVAPFMRNWVVREPGNLSTRFRLHRGDVDAAKDQAFAVVEDRFQTQRMEHFSMEPHAAVVSYDPSTGRLKVWSSTGKPFRTLGQLSLVLGIPMSRMQLLHLPAGGDFGGKGELTIEPYCALLSMRTGRPVKGVYTREEEFLASTCKTPFEIQMSIGATEDGRLLFMDGLLRADTGPYNSMSCMVSIHAATHMEGPYHVPNVRVESATVYTNNTLSGSFRGFGAPQVGFARENLLDRLAARLGMDPYELRLKNAWEPGAVTCTGQVLSPDKYSVSIRQTLEAIRDTVESSRAAAAEQPRPHIRRGWGIACAHHGIGGAIWSGADTSTVMLKVNLDGTVAMLAGIPEVGQGANTSLVQIVADALALPLSSIIVADQDTASVPYVGGASASRTIHVTGNAARIAGENLRAKMLELGALVLQADRDALTCANGTVFVTADPARVATFEEIVAYAMRCLGEQPMAVGTYRAVGQPMDPEGRGEPFLGFDFATQLAEVEVDVETGQVRVTRLCTAVDVGKAINPTIVEGQIEGGAVMGMGFALSEEILLDSGQIVNPYAFDYRIPRFADLPDLSTILLETSDPGGPHGAKGAGEISMIPTAGAIANAIFNATGAVVTQLPMTPERVLAAIRRGEKTW